MLITRCFEALLGEIFTYVRQKDWFNVMLVCKLWCQKGRTVFDPSYNLRKIMIRLCQRKNMSALEFILRDPRVFKHKRFIEYIAIGLGASCVKGHVTIVDRLLKFKDLDNDMNWKFYSIDQAIINGHVRLVKRLLEDSRIILTHRKKRPYDNYIRIVENEPLRIRIETVDQSYSDCLLTASETGQYDILQLLLKDARIDPDKGKVALVKACNHGYPAIVRLLLKDVRINQAIDLTYLNEALILSCGRGQREIVKTILNDPRVDPAINQNICIRIASQNGRDNIVDLLMQCPRVNPSDKKNHAIRLASKNGHVRVVQRLMKDPRVNPSADDNFALINASKNGHAQVVRALLKDSRVNCSTKHLAYALFAASQSGCVKVIQTLMNLRKSLLLYAIDIDHAFQLACRFGQTKSVQLLLKHPRVDTCNIALEQVCEKGYTNIARLLLKDPRVDPSAKENVAIRNASRYGHTAIVKLLLNDPRVDPSDQNNCALLQASLRYHEQIVKLLLKDPRVNPSQIIRNVTMGVPYRILKLLLRDPRTDSDTINNCLHRACMHNQGNMVRILLKHPKLDPSVINDAIQSVLKYSGRYVIVKMLLRAKINHEFRENNNKAYFEIVTDAMKHNSIDVFSTIWHRLERLT